MASNWELVASDGGDRQLYAKGQVGVVVEGDKVFPPGNLQSIYARGGWLDPEPDAEDKGALVAKHVDTKGG